MTNMRYVLKQQIFGHSSLINNWEVSIEDNEFDEDLNKLIVPNPMHTYLQPTASSNEFSSAYVLKCDDEDDDVWVVPPGGIASYLTHSLAMEIGSVNLSHLSNEQ